MLSNAYFLAKFRFDTAENEPAKNLQNFAKFANFADPNPLSPTREKPVDTLGVGLRVLRGLQVKEDPKECPPIGKIASSKIGKISNILQIFGGLVLGCIKTKFCKKICV